MVRQLDMVSFVREIQPRIDWISDRDANISLEKQI